MGCILVPLRGCVLVKTLIPAFSHERPAWVRMA
jgi:hypothetical protein